MHVCSQYSTIFILLAVVTVMQVIDICAVPVAELYPFGPSAGDNALPSGDDGNSGAQFVNIATRFFGRQVNMSSYFVSCL